MKNDSGNNSFSNTQPGMGSPMKEFADQPHYHRDEQGFLVKCYHQAKTNYVGFIVGTMVSFPIEHYLYEKVWPFYLVSTWLGL